MAQTKVPARSQQIIQEIIELAEDGLSKIEIDVLSQKHPIYKIDGVHYISFLSKIDNNFRLSEIDESVLTGAQVGDIFSFKFPLDQLNEIHSKVPNLEILEVSPSVQPMVDRTVWDTRSDSVHLGSGLNDSYTGRNVIIGITDWGFDYTHPNFYDTSLDQTRILASWDQFRMAGPNPNGFSYGTEIVGATDLLNYESDTACTYYDYAYHGTHVGGIAGGSGAGTELRGIAFESEFLFSQFYLDAASNIDAVQWMKDFAENEGKRLVVNMSWGLYHLGPYDGTSLLSQALDAFTEDGVVIVTSGGNNGDVNFHIKQDFSGNNLVGSVIESPGWSPHDGNNILMWGEEGKQFEAGLGFVDGSSSYFTPLYNTHQQKNVFDTTVVFSGDSLSYSLMIDSAYATNGQPHMVINLKNTSPNITASIWARAQNGTVHFWNVAQLDNGSGNWGFDFIDDGGQGKVAGDNAYGVGEPACTEKVISVAAHRSEVRLTLDTINGDITSFSSRGPTTDERIKPDLSAPGQSVESSVSSFTTRNYTPSQSVQFNGKTYEFATASGTSMSGPAVSGIVALMLEANDKLSPEEARNILIETAREDDKTGSLPQGGNPIWGHGKATAMAAVKKAEELVGIADLNQDQQIRIFPNPTKEVLFIDSEVHAVFEIYSIDAKLVSDGRIDQGLNSINVSSFEPGMYLIRTMSEAGVSRMKFVVE